MCVWLSFSLCLSLCLIHTVSIIDETTEEAISKGSDGTRRPFSLKFEPQGTLTELLHRAQMKLKGLQPVTGLTAPRELSRGAVGIYTIFTGMNCLQRCKID